MLNNFFSISDHTFYAQSQIMVEKFLNFQQNLSGSLRQGMENSGHWCHMTFLDHVTPVGGWQLGCPGRCRCSVQAPLGVFWWPPWISSLTRGLPCPSQKFGNFFHHNLTLCAECFIRKYIYHYAYRLWILISTRIHLGQLTGTRILHVLITWSTFWISLQAFVTKGHNIKSNASLRTL